MTYMEKQRLLAELDRKIDRLEYDIEDTKRELRATRGLDRVLLRDHLRSQFGQLARYRKAAAAL